MQRKNYRWHVFHVESIIVVKKTKKNKRNFFFKEKIHFDHFERKWNSSGNIKIFLKNSFHIRFCSNYVVQSMKRICIQTYHKSDVIWWWICKFKEVSAKIATVLTLSNLFMHWEFEMYQWIYASHLNCCEHCVQLSNLQMKSWNVIECPFTAISCCNKSFEKHNWK